MRFEEGIGLVLHSNSKCAVTTDGQSFMVNLNLPMEVFFMPFLMTRNIGDADVANNMLHLIKQKQFYNITFATGTMLDINKVYKIIVKDNT